MGVYDVAGFMTPRSTEKCVVVTLFGHFLEHRTLMRNRAMEAVSKQRADGEPIANNLIDRGRGQGLTPIFHIKERGGRTGNPDTGLSATCCINAEEVK